MKHILMAVMLGIAAVPAWAQNPQPAEPHAPPPPSGPTPVAPPERMAPRDGGATGSTMSDQLSRDRGTLTPPSHVDPGMTVHPGNQGAGSMPVIPPPGTPGGNPTVVPK
jgi:hypothetical protein